MAANLLLLIKTGPHKGKTYPLSGGDDILIGRKGMDINLPDGRVSSLHARISRTGNRWILQDNQSKNGVRLPNGERVEILKLKPGTKFQIGDHLFEVVEESLKAEPAPTRDLNLSAVTGPPAAPLRPRKQPKYWNAVLADFLEMHSNRFQDRIIALTPLEPALILEFVRGIQVNSKWILGFGPRFIGSDSLDLPIWEPGSPGVCFEIHPGEEGLIFKTQHPELVNLNGLQTEHELLRIGDTIKIMETLIEVDFVE